jgi:L-arabinonolactonase
VLGEGVLWHPKEQTLYWTDIEGKSLYKCSMTQEVTQMLCAEPANKHTTALREEYLHQVLQVFDLPSRLGSFAFTNSTDTLLAGFEDGLALYNYTNNELTWLSQQEVNSDNIRFNDGKCDHNGRYWLGSMVEKDDIKKMPIEEQGSLYSFSFEKGQLVSERALSGVHI